MEMQMNIFTSRLLQMLFLLSHNFLYQLILEVYESNFRTKCLIFCPKTLKWSFSSYLLAQNQSYIYVCMFLYISCYHRLDLQVRIKQEVKNK